MRTGTARVVEAAEAFLACAAGFDLTAETTSDCRSVAELAARVEKAAGGMRLLAAARAVEGGAHKDAGMSDPVSWMARQGGTTGAQARQALELARTLDAHPDTKDALLSGAVSIAQAEEVARSEAELPGSERELLAFAMEQDLTRLRDETRERRLTRTPPEDLHKAQHAARRFRHWRDELGMVAFEGALPPETGIPFVNRVEREAVRLRKALKAVGCPERFEAYAADALVTVSAGSGDSARSKTDLVIVCDVYAWRRGHAHPGEPCHLIGGGPIPVGLAKQ
ncbi:MAG TPA: hypothetical protein VMD28_06750, partial [Acidimicrobiales bacterium]|nr:hypothetical protein [Acidimicrobiales bacterium]